MEGEGKELNNAVENEGKSTLLEKVSHKAHTLLPWVLVVIAIGTLRVTYSKMTDQVEEMKKATELQWRPFLNIVIEDQKPQLYAIGEKNEQGLSPGGYLDWLDTSSILWTSLRYVKFECDRNFTLINSGKTPLRIYQRVYSALTKEKWVDDLKKSPEKLIKFLNRPIELSPVEIDIIILPDSSKTFNQQEIMFPTMIEINQLREAITHSPAGIVFYPFAYVAYEDFFGNRYNMLHIEYMIFQIEMNGSVIELDTLVKVGLEKYRWDIESE